MCLSECPAEARIQAVYLNIGVESHIYNFPSDIISSSSSSVVVIIIVVVVFVVKDKKFVCLSDIAVPVLFLFLACP
jgi:hypothetical protein